MKTYDVVTICNALMDILIKVEESDITRLELNKGVMHLVDSSRQSQILNEFSTREQTIELGGSALNALRSIATLGGRTLFAGMVGQDDFGSRIIHRLNDLNIDCQLKEITHEQTGTCLILVTPDGERTMNTCLGASRLYDETLVPYNALANAKILHFCGYQWDTEDQMQAIYKAMDEAKAKNVLISFDVADPFVVERNKDEFRRIITEYADIVFANERESELLFDVPAEQAAMDIAKCNATAVVKLGAKGAVIVSNGNTFKIEPEATHVVDTTAAGDMFAGGFLFAYAKDQPLSICGQAAAILAADVISRVGTTVSTEAYHRVKSLLS